TATQGSRGSATSTEATRCTASSAAATATRSPTAASRCRTRRQARSTRTRRSGRSSASPEGGRSSAPNSSSLTTTSEHTEVTAGWTQALSDLDGDLRRRAVAERTRRAYAIDTHQFATWASERGIAPDAVDVRNLRRFVASVSERGCAPATVARKLAALRALLRVQVALGK